MLLADEQCLFAARLSCELGPRSTFSILHYGNRSVINLIAWCIFGLIVGALARFLMPGRDPMGCIATTAVGVVGSFLGGFLGALLFGGGVRGEFQPAGFIGALIGALLLLWLLRVISGKRA